MTNCKKIFKFLICSAILLSVKLQVAGQLFSPLDTTQIKLNVQVLEKDSGFFLIPELIVKSNEIKIKIPKKIIYCDANICVGSGKIYLQKKMLNVYASIGFNLHVDGYAIEADQTFKNYSDDHKITDTIPLSQYYPIDKGKYRIMVELTYMYKDKKYNINSNLFDFIVNYIPKDAQW